MSSSRSRNLQSAAVVAAVVAIAAVGVVIARSNSSESERDRNIAGGTDVAISGAPYQVALLSSTLSADGQPDGGTLACGGSIISASWVLTADHCIARDASGRTRPDQVTIAAGQSNFWGPYPRASVRTAVQLMAARGPGVAWPNADLMLIQLASPLQFSSTIRPVRLPLGLDNSTWPAQGATGLITGWGATLDDAARTTLRGVTMKVNSTVQSDYCVDDAEPSRAYFYPSTFVPAQHLCLMRPTNTVRASACSGDSGGPFVMTVGDVPVLTGVASKASRDPDEIPFAGTTVCTGYTPNLYVRVASALDWIIPGRVTSLVPSFSGNTATLSWLAPQNAPAAPITDYEIEYRVDGATEWSMLNDGTSDVPGATITGLTNGQSVEVRVSGVNAVNSSDATMRTFATLNFVVGVVPTTTTTTTTIFTTTTLPRVTTTVAPSTTARQVQIGTRPTNSATSTTMATVTTPAAAPQVTVSGPATTAAAPQTTVAAAKSAATPTVKIEGEDPVFSQPKVVIPAGVDLPVPQKSDAAPDSAPARPVPVVGGSLTGLQVAEITGTAVPAGSSVSVTVGKGSAKVCRATGSVVSFLAKGTCKATLRVGAKPSSAKKKTVRLTVS